MNFRNMIQLSRRSPRITLLIVLAIGIPIAALANDVFTDVPAAAIFHDAANAIARAGITTGCATGLYCPNANVTRAQMALFMHRGFGRVGRSSFNTVLNAGTPFAYVGQITLTPGLPADALAGASAFVTADGHVNIFVSDSAGCPCLLRTSWYDETEVQYMQDNYNYITIPAGTNDQYFQLSSSGSARVSSSVPHVYSIWTSVASGTGSFVIFGDAKVEYFPFGSTGTNTFGPQPTVAQSEASARFRTPGN